MVYNVLLVDDEELVRKVLQLTLENSDLPIKILGLAANGREALEQVRSTRPQLIIMDIKMPGIDGIEATKQIKAAYPTTEVIILTAYNEFQYSQQAIKAQATDYLLKPIQPQQLLTAVKDALERLNRKNIGPGPEVAYSQPHGNNFLVQQAMDYIQANYTKKFSLKEVANHVHLSPAYLSRLFNKKTGHGFAECLTQVRIKNAKHYLEFSDSTIDHIAFATGFSSSSYFSTLFRWYEGITPSEYRAILKNKA